MEKSVIDVHVHFGAPEDGVSGCFWSKKFERTPAYYMMLFVTHSIFKKINIQRVQNHLLKQINGAKRVEKSVLLALDMVYDEQGNERKEWSHLYVPNTYLVQLAAENKRILFGCSVHPYRQDWREEIDYCLENKAVLCKWIPSSQMVDPSSEKCVPFYQKLADHKLPLLCHAGPEYAIPTNDSKYNKYNNPKYLKRALDMGVTVIIAHCALPYFGFLDFEYQDDLADFYKLFNKAERNNWKLYADLSAVATPLRAPYIERIVNEIPHDRLLFGSDYPIPASELSYTKSKNFFKWLKLIWQAIHIRNPLDKNYRLLKNMGFDDKMFFNASELFNQIVY